MTVNAVAAGPDAINCGSTIFGYNELAEFAFEVLEAIAENFVNRSLAYGLEHDVSIDAEAFAGPFKLSIVCDPGGFKLNATHVSLAEKSYRHRKVVNQYAIGHGQFLLVTAGTHLFRPAPVHKADFVGAEASALHGDINRGHAAADNNDATAYSKLAQILCLAELGNVVDGIQNAVEAFTLNAQFIHTTESAGSPWQVVRASNIGEQFELVAGDEPRTQFNGWLTWESSKALAELGGHDLEALIESARSHDFQPVSLGVTTSIDFTVDVKPNSTANVAGILRGSDPELADEIVVLSAHHDHFGIGEPDETGDVIYNGALDNGVAMAQALAVGGAFAELPDGPRRSILIFFPAVEEQGILGSKYFSKSGVVHPGRMVTDINFELGNVWGKTSDVIIYGLGKSELDDWLTEAARTQNRTIRGEQDVKAGWFYRSDQISFARIGVPAIWFKSGVDFIGREPGWGEKQYADWISYKYHTPGDEVDESWVFDGLVEDAQLGFMLAAAIADAEVTPTWYAGDEFEATRQEALADLGK